MSDDTEVAREALLACPFCGGDAEMDTQQSYINIGSGNLQTGIAIYCLSCGVHQMTCRGDVPDVEPEEVIAAWNTRSIPAAAALLREAGWKVQEPRSQTRHICDYPTCSKYGGGHPLACGCGPGHDVTETRP